jgi:hypothetical protein
LKKSRQVKQIFVQKQCEGGTPAKNANQTAKNGEQPTPENSPSPEMLTFVFIGAKWN